MSKEERNKTLEKQIKNIEKEVKVWEDKYTLGLEWEEGGVGDVCCRVNRVINCYGLLDECMKKLREENQRLKEELKLC